MCAIIPVQIPWLVFGIPGSQHCFKIASQRYGVVEALEIEVARRPPRC